MKPAPPHTNAPELVIRGHREVNYGIVPMNPGPPRFSNGLLVTAIDVVNAAGNEAGARGGEEYDNTGGFVGPSEPFERQYLTRQVAHYLHYFRLRAQIETSAPSWRTPRQSLVPGLGLLQ